MKQILVTAAVMTQDGRVFLAQRLPGGNEGGKWEFPGGKMEPGEDPRSCLQRELQEELGIEVEVDGPVDVISVVRDDIQLILIYFQCRILHGEPRPIECQQVGWFRPDEIENLEMPPADRIFWKRFKTK